MYNKSVYYIKYINLYFDQLIIDIKFKNYNYNYLLNNINI